MHSVLARRQENMGWQARRLRACREDQQAMECKMTKGDAEMIFDRTESHEPENVAVLAGEAGEGDDGRVFQQSQIFFSAMSRVDKDTARRVVVGQMLNEIDAKPGANLNDTWRNAVLALASLRSSTLDGVEAKVSVMREYLDVMGCCQLVRLLFASIGEDVSSLKKEGGIVSG